MRKASLLLIILVLFSSIGTFGVKAAASKQIYVAATGNDSNSGDISSPVKTIEKARSMVRDIKKAGSLPDGGIEVIIRGGTYKREVTFALEKTDSGEQGKPIVYKAYEGEEVIFTAADEIDVKNFSVVTDSSVLDRLPEESKGKVVSANLKKLGITGYGELQRKIYAKPLTSEFEIFFNHQPLNISRWPNTRYILTGEILNDGDSGIEFKCDEERITRWTKAKEALLYGFWRANWGDDSLHLKEIDEKNMVVKTVESPSLGLQADRRFYIYNLLEEIDLPGEYYLDRANGVLYFYPPEEMDGAVITYSTFVDKFLTTNDTSYVTFNNLIFDGSCGDGLNLIKGNEVIFENCKIRNIAGRAVNVEYIQGGGFFGNEIYNIGNAGIVIYNGDRGKLISSDYKVMDNHIYKFSRYNKTYNPAIAVNGIGNIISNNLIHDAPHVGLMFNGNENIIEKNEFYDLLQDTDDCGVIYAGRNWSVWGNVIRQNYIHDINGPGAWSVGIYLDDSLSGTTIEKNILINVTAPIEVGGGRDNIVNNNIILNKNTNSSVSIVFDDRGVQPWYADPINKDFANSELYKNLVSSPYKNEIWAEKYPNLYTILDDEPMMPKRNTVKYNLIVKHAKANIASTVSELGDVESNWETAKDIDLFVDENGKLYFEDESVLEKFIGFEPIDFSDIGLTGNGNYTIPKIITDTTGDGAASSDMIIWAEPINVETLITDSQNWDVNKTEAKFSGNEMVIKPGTAGYNAKTFKDGNLHFKFKVELDNEDFSWCAVTARSNKSDKAPWEDANGYSVIIKKSIIEFQRWLGGTQIMIGSVSNTYVTTNNWYDMDFTTVSTDDQTGISFKINDEEIFTFIDKDDFAIKKEGYITFFNGGKEQLVYIAKADKEVDLSVNPYADGISVKKDEDKPAEAAEEAIKITIDGKILKTDVSPIIIEGRTLVPFRAIFEAFGCKVAWDEPSRTVTAEQGDESVSLVINDREAVVFGKIKAMEVPPMITDGRTLVPVRFVAESLGAKVDWDEEARTVVITK